MSIPLGLALAGVFLFILEKRMNDISQTLP